MKKIISHVVALSNNNVIGVDNMLPWNLKRDLQHFKNYTTNKILLMGRKTYESIGRPLPNRINYVISTTIDEIDGAEVFKSIDDALDVANKKCDDHSEYNEIVIIGGGYLFRDTLKIANKLVLTNVNCEIEGDVFYPDIDFNEWQEKSSQNFSKDIDNDYDFKVRVLERV
jgi:dihydrofolate reductase